MAARGLSLHVGLNRVDGSKYIDPDGKPWDGALPACEKDAADMAAVAHQRGFTASTLLTTDATADNIVGHIREAAGALSPGDIFFVSFSGHGGQVPDANGKEPDGLDETWVAYDRQVSDDELFFELARFRPGVRVVVASDSCHSGSIVDSAPNALVADVTPGPVAVAGLPEGLWVKAMPAGVARADARNRAGLYLAIQGSVPDADDSVQGLEASVLEIAACRDDQLAGATAEHSLYTAAFVATLNSPAFNGTYVDLHRQLIERLPDHQTPVLSGPAAEDPAFVGQRPLTI